MIKGEMIDSIEHNFVKVGGYVEDGIQNVNTAITNRKKATEVNTAVINPKRRRKVKNLI
jgi:hypothetical protein